MMTLFGILRSSIGKYAAMALAALVAIAAAYRSAYNSGRNTERAKAKQAEIDGLNEQLEMNRDASAIERTNAALSDQDARTKAARRMS